MDKHRDITTLLLAREHDQASDILGVGDFLLLNLDDDIAGTQSGVCRRTVLGDLGHHDAMARCIIDPCQTPAWTGSGGRWKSGARGGGVGNFLYHPR